MCLCGAAMYGLCKFVLFIYCVYSKYVHTLHTSSLCMEERRARDTLNVAAMECIHICIYYVYIHNTNVITNWNCTSTITHSKYVRFHMCGIWLWHVCMVDIRFTIFAFSILPNKLHQSTTQWFDGSNGVLIIISPRYCIFYMLSFLFLSLSFRAHAIFICIAWKWSRYICHVFYNLALFLRSSIPFWMPILFWLNSSHWFKWSSWTDGSMVTFKIMIRASQLVSMHHQNIIYIYSHMFSSRRSKQNDRFHRMQCCFLMVWNKQSMKNITSPSQSLSIAYFRGIKYISRNVQFSTDDEKL